jgi:L-ascorbate metabolism protein UlaG (beta-lactamase superfamily)
LKARRPSKNICGAAAAALFTRRIIWISTVIDHRYNYLTMKLAFCVLLLSASFAHAGLEKYSALVMADAKPDAPPPRDAVRVTYLGVNGFQFENGNHVLIVDPYFTRVDLGAVVFNRAIDSNPKRVEDGIQHIRTPADAVLVTHAHFDHLLDVPSIMRQTHARLLAGPTAVNLVESFGIKPSQCEIVGPGMKHTIGPWNIRVFAATHDRIIGNSPPFPGTVTAPTRRPTKASDWKLGEPLAFLIEAAGKRIYIDSGGVPGYGPDAAIGHVDLAILGVALPDSRRRFPEAVLRLQPGYILPSHQDDFFVPLSRGFVFGKLTNFPGIMRMHKKEHLPRRLILLDYFRPWTLP